jgi:putative hydrolase of the HAD superfamily
LDALPRVAIGGREIPTTAGALHAAFARRHPIELEAFAAALREVDRGWRQAYWEQGRELPTLHRFELLLERLGVADVELAALLTDTHMRFLAALARTPPHHGAVLERLRRRVRTGVCSNFSWSPTARGVLAAGGLDAHLDAVLISHDLGLRKPRREIFEALLERLGAGPEEVIHVGDNLDADVAGASAAGLRTIWITRCVRDPAAALAAYAGPAPTWRVADLAEIEALVSG